MKLNKWSRKTILVAGLLLFLTLPLVTLALAQTGGGYDLTWNTGDGGGGRTSGGGYTLTGTVGQHDTGAVGGSGYSLLGGFWGSGARVVAAYDIYLPVTLRVGQAR